MEEIWKKVVGSEMYQVSNLGRIKGNERIANTGHGGKRFLKSRIMSLHKNHNGYLQFLMQENNTIKCARVHQLVVMAFIDPNYKLTGKEVNHINHVRTDNRLENLEIITRRENVNKRNMKFSSNYVGVMWSKAQKKWTSSIRVNQKSIHLGCFTDEKEASRYYQNAIIAIENNTQIIRKLTRKTPVPKPRIKVTNRFGESVTVVEYSLKKELGQRVWSKE
jgi:hypothetical protein